MKKYYVNLIVLMILTWQSQANVLQYFTGISYSNPAELFKIKKNELLIGTTAFYADLQFNGTVLNLNSSQYDRGISYSRRGSILPYGRIAMRATKKLVVGVDLTEPFHSNLRWEKNAVTRYAANETLMTDVNVSPRFAYQLLPYLNIGAAINFNFLKNNETNWTLPTGPRDYAILTNPTTGFGVGWAVGFYYLINKKNFLGGTYYSAIKQNTAGTSYFNGMSNTNLRFDFNFPPTSILTYVHFFNPKWLTNVQMFYTEWNINKLARIKNTAYPPPQGPHFAFPLQYDGSLAYSGALRHQFNEKLGLTLIGLIDTGPEQEHLRNLNFPSDVQYFIALAADTQLSKKTTIELLYGHVFSNTTLGNFIPINNTLLPFTTGKVKINADVVDLRLKIQV